MPVLHLLVEGCIEGHRGHGVADPFHVAVGAVVDHVVAGEAGLHPWEHEKIARGQIPTAWAQISTAWAQIPTAREMIQGRDPPQGQKVRRDLHEKAAAPAARSAGTDAMHRLTWSPNCKKTIAGIEKQYFKEVRQINSGTFSFLCT